MTKGLPRSLSRGPASQAPIRKERIAFSVPLTVTATGDAVGFGTAAIGELPEGNIVLLAAIAYVRFSGSGVDANLTATWEGDYSIGSAPTTDVTLSGTEVDIIASTAIPAATAEVSPIVQSNNVTAVVINNTDGSREINLNVLIDAAHITDDASVVLTCAGELNILYSVLSDD